MKSTIKLALLAIPLLALLFAASGCQTGKGFGKDVEDLGEEIQDAAN